MEYIEAKTILSKIYRGQYWFGIDYTMNLYKGCCHNCIYCDSRSNCYKIENFEQVRAKKNAIELLKKELNSKKVKGVIGLGAMSDPYNPFEKKEQLTQKALEAILENGFGVSLETKSTLITRDIPLFKKINQKQPVILKVTITTADNELAKKIEPNASSTIERLETVKQLSEAGLFVGVLMNPILPYINDTEQNIKQMVFLAHTYKAKFIHTYMSVTLRENQRVYYYEQLKKQFPNILPKYHQFYTNKYECKPQNYKKLMYIFKKECEKYGILYKMSDIVASYKPQKNQQLTLF